MTIEREALLDLIRRGGGLDAHHLINLFRVRAEARGHGVTRFILFVFQDTHLEMHELTAYHLRG